MAIELQSAFVRIRADVSGFAQDALGKIRPALRSVQSEVASVAAANVAQTAKEIRANQELAASYLAIGRAAEKGSQEQVAAMRLAGDATARVNQQLGRVEQTARGGLGFAGIGSRAVRTAAAMTGLAGGAYLVQRGLRSVVLSGADFETSLNVFQSVSQASAVSMRDASDEAKRLGNDITLPGVSAADAAQAMTELAKGGVSVQDTIESARGTLQLATAGMLDNATAAGIVAQQLNVFGLAGNQATHVADLLANASASAQGEVSDMAIALQQSAAVARQAGFSVDQTVAAIALLAKNGVLGSDAGTSLRTTLLRLVPTTKEAATQVEALGIHVADQQGRLLPLAQIFEQYRNVLARLTPVQQQQALTTIFGTDAIRAASIFAREGADGFAAMESAVGRAGGAFELSSARTKGLEGSIGALRSTLETIGISIAERINPTIKEWIDNLNEGNNLQQLTNRIMANAGEVIDAVRTAWETVVPPIEAAVDAVGGVENAVKLMVTAWASWKVTGLIANIARTTGEMALMSAQARTLRLRLIALQTLGPIVITLTVIGAKKVADEIERLQKQQIEAEEASAKRGSRVRTTLIPDLAEDINRLKAQGLSSAEILKQLRDRLGGSLKADDIIADAFVFSRQGRSAAKDRLVEEINGPVMGALNQVASDAGVRDSAKQAGSDIGTQVSTGVADAVKTGLSDRTKEAIAAIRDQAAEAIDRLNERLRDQIQQTKDAVRDSVLSAQQNLVSLGGTLAQQLTQIIEAGPLGQALKRLERLQANRSQAGQRQGLEATLANAQEELAKAQAGIVGTPRTAAQRALVGDILQPRRDEVRRAERAIADFDLNRDISQLRTIIANQQTGAGRQVTNLTDAFVRGEIGEGRFTSRLTALLGRSGAAGAAGTLGRPFAGTLSETVGTIVAQAKLLASAPGAAGLAGLGGAPELVNPRAVLNEQLAVQREIRDEIKLTRTEAAAREKEARTKDKKKSEKKDDQIVRLPGGQTANARALAGTT